jgi:hypothetical protein
MAHKMLLATLALILSSVMGCGPSAPAKITYEGRFIGGSPEEAMWHETGFDVACFDKVTTREYAGHAPISVLDADGRGEHEGVGDTKMMDINFTNKEGRTIHKAVMLESQKQSVTAGSPKFWQEVRVTVKADSTVCE